MNNSAFAPRQPQPAEKWVSLGLAVAMHLGLLVLLLYGIRWQTAKPPEGVEVELYRSVPLAARPPAPVEEVKPLPKPEPAPKPAPRVEPPPPAKPDIAVKQTPPEKPKPVAKPIPEVKPEPKPEPKRDPMLDKLNRELDQLNTRRAVASVDQDLAQLKAGQASAARNRAIAGYADKIRAAIRGKLRLPPDVKGNPEAEFDVEQLPSGEVLAVKLRKSSGYRALDEAIERAIMSASPLPKPEDTSLFQRNLALKFRPLDE